MEKYAVWDPARGTCLQRPAGSILWWPTRELAQAWADRCGGIPTDAEYLLANWRDYVLAGITASTSSIGFADNPGLDS